VSPVIETTRRGAWCPSPGPPFPEMRGRGSCAPSQLSHYRDEEERGLVPPPGPPFTERRGRE